MLLVDDAKPEIIEHHSGFDQCVRPNEDLHLAGGQGIEYGAAALSFDIAREQLHANAQILELSRDSFVVLLRQDLCRRHDARLKTIVESQQTSQCGHHRLARSHISLQQTVHLSATAQITMDLAHHAFLCFGEFKRDMVGIEIFEQGTNARKGPTGDFHFPFSVVLENGKLQIEEFFKFQPTFGRRHVLCALRKVQISHRAIVAHQFMLRHECRRQGVGDRSPHAFKGIGHQFIDGARGDVRTREALSEMIDRLHAQEWAILHPLQLLHLRVGNRKVVAERFGFAKHLIFDIHLVHFLQSLRHAEPNQLNVARTIGEVGHKSAFRSFAHLVDHHNAPPQLNILHSLDEIADAMHLGAVLVSERISVQ